MLISKSLLISKTIGVLGEAAASSTIAYGKGRSASLSK